MVNNYCPTCQHEQNSIGFCDKCFYSKMFEEDGIAPTMYERRPTNADRIRAMGDEELAEFMINGCDCIAPSDNCYTPHYDCKMCWLDWLQQEAAE